MDLLFPNPFTLPMKGRKLVAGTLSLMMILYAPVSRTKGEFALSSKKHLGWLVSVLWGVGRLDSGRKDSTIL